ncbi:MAG: 2-oxo acid dehydrogenase subunit E2 [Terriglobales bacterium]
MKNDDCLTVDAIIIQPQAAILAVGRIADRVVAVNGHPGVRPMITLTLSSDHRVVDGARAAEFLRDLAAAIGNPEQTFDNARAGD